MSDPDRERLDERLRAVERAITESARPPADLADAAEATDRIAAVEADLVDVEERLAELEAATRALRGYVGTVRSAERDGPGDAPPTDDAGDRGDRDPGTGDSSGRDGGREDATGDADPGDADGWPTPWNAAGDGGTAGDVDAQFDRADPPDRGNGGRREGEPPAGDRRHERDRRGTDRGDDAPGETGRTASEDGSTGPDRDPVGNARDPEPADPGAGGRAGEHPRSPRGRPGDGDPSGDTWGEAAWPGADDRGAAEPRSDGGAWPRDGMDVDRAQPWAVPDPGGEDWERDDGESKGLLARVRESL